MKIKYEGQTYVLTFWHAVSVKIQKKWFSYRRFLRAIKRCCLNLKSWIPIFLVFTPVALIMLFVLWVLKLIDFQTIVLELAFFFLGSFLLLAIKETIDSEKKRHKALRNQWEFCSELHGRFGQSLKIIGGYFGLQIDKWQSLYGYSEMTSQVENICVPTMLSEDDVNIICNEVTSIKEALALIRDEMRYMNFVDCILADSGSWLLSDTETEVNDFLRCVNKSEYEQANRIFKTLCFDCLRIVGDLRTPWRYEMDIAHKELIEKSLALYATSY